MKAVCCLTVLCLCLISATNPGFKTRITQRAFTYANGVAMRSLASSVRRLSIPSHRGSSMGVTYWLERMSISEFYTPRSNMQLRSGIQWSMTGGRISLHGDFSRFGRRSKIQISDRGTFLAKFNGVSFNLKIRFNVFSGKLRLTAYTSDCACTVDSVVVAYSKGTPGQYRAMTIYIEENIKIFLRQRICQLLLQSVNNDANNKLGRLHMSVLLGRFLADYNMIGGSVVGNYLETMHKGEVYWNSDRKECPFSPPPLPYSGSASNMLYMWVSQYMGNSLTYSGFKHGFFQYNLTATDLPAANRSLLNTTCSDGKCIGSLIPQIGQRYPKSTVTFRMHATSPPMINIDQGVININFTGNIDLYAHTPQGKTPFLLTITCTLLSNVTVAVQSERLLGKISGSKFIADVHNSTVGNVSSPVLHTVMTVAIDGFMVPTLNAQGQKGLVLPVTGNVRFTRTQLYILEGSVVIATDLSLLSVNATRGKKDDYDDLSMRDYPKMSFNVIGEKTGLLDEM